MGRVVTGAVLGERVSLRNGTKQRKDSAQIPCPIGACATVAADGETFVRLVVQSDPASRFAPEPDHCRYCARALTEKAKSDEATRAGSWLQRVRQA